MFQRTTALLTVVLAASVTASADFSYTTSQKMTGGSMAAMAGANADRTNKIYFKGQKMLTSTGDIAIIMDFGAQTITTINNAQKTYTVKKFSDVAGAAGNTEVTFDVKDTGQKKVVNGFNASETIITMSMDMDAGRGGPPMKMQMEMDLWISSDVPGVGDMRAFYQKNLANFPWAAMSGGGGNASMQKAMAQMERKLAELNGIAVERIIRIKPAGGAAAPQMAQMPQMTPEQQAQMQAAMAKLQQMQSQGGPGAAAAQQAMANMGNMGAMMGGAGRGSASGAGSMMEMTIDASGFSNASVADSVFAVPAGYKQTQ